MSVAPERRHVVADVTGGTAAVLDDVELLTELLSRSASEAGATVLGHCAHRFDPSGVTVLVMLAESHVSIHTWPESGHAFVDAFTCGEVDPQNVVAVIVDELGGSARCAAVSAT